MVHVGHGPPVHGPVVPVPVVQVVPPPESGLCPLLGWVTKLLTIAGIVGWLAPFNVTTTVIRL